MRADAGSRARWGRGLLLWGLMASCFVALFGCKPSKPRDPKPDASAPPPELAHPSGEAQPLRIYDFGLSNWLGVSTGEDTRADIFPDIAARADLHRRGDVFGRIDVDVERDGEWDEVWRLEGAEIIRLVKTGERAGRRYALRDKQWIRLK